MALADRTDYEKRLSTICDIAVILDISDDEIADIVYKLLDMFTVILS